MLPLLLVFLFPSLTWASVKEVEHPQLLVLTSNRNAETIADAAALLATEAPGYSVVARTGQQLLELPPEQIRQLLDGADAVLGLGLYGPVVEQLRTQLGTVAQPRLLINSDPRLVELSRFPDPLFEDAEQLREITTSIPGPEFESGLADQLRRYPRQEPWILARAYWQAGGSANTAELFKWIYVQLGASLEPRPPQPAPQLRWLFGEKEHTKIPRASKSAKKILAIIDHAGASRPADRALLRAMCERLESQGNLRCLSALAYWGKAGVDAISQLKALGQRLSGLVMLQDFVVGGGEGRTQVSQMLGELNVPVYKAIKLRDRDAATWRLSMDGLGHDKVHYQVAMPELQGASQPVVVATAGHEVLDQRTGIRVQAITPEPLGIESLHQRVQAWNDLQTLKNKDKRVAIIFYNHPPGRHNIGADNLDVPATLHEMLLGLQKAGYDTGDLPDSPEALLDQLQAKAINLPRDHQAMLEMRDQVQTMSAQTYERWFLTLPDTVQREMLHGPLGLLHEQFKSSVNHDRPELARQAMERGRDDLLHMLEGLDHPARPRALALLDQLMDCYTRELETGQDQCGETAWPLIEGLRDTGIEGLAGWGPAPGEVMTLDNEFLFPGIRFGNIFVGPQPPRGWEVNEELVHANLALPPPHQYLAFYHFLQHEFQAHALVHVGRHSTYEFLPRRSVGLAEDDYATIIAGDLPGIYPYIVDGVGEGIQAKRRGLAVTVDHLTPPLEHTPLYDELLQLRQSVESFEANHGLEHSALRERLVEQIRDQVDALALRDELVDEMSDELAIMGITFEQVEDDMLVHAVGHYLTELQERFMPLGLHVLRRPWKRDALDMMIKSMAPPDRRSSRRWRKALQRSPRAEWDAILGGLAGGFVAPGPGNDPIRSPDSLPTGRNFYALDSSLIPSPAAWQLGQELAQQARQTNSQNPEKREALVLWASDVVRDEGVMIAFGLDMLGLKPVWNSRGIVTSLEQQGRGDQDPRRDVLFTTSGLFRDLYGQQMQLLDRATLMAIDASADLIRDKYPALQVSLDSALESLGESKHGGRESLTTNQVAKHWIKQTAQLLAQQVSATEAGAMASFRVFGDAPGSYGAGINRMVERSGAWERREELADLYRRRLGHSYGSSGFGRAAPRAFGMMLADVENAYFGRSSNLYGLIDNNDTFDYLGGLSLAVEMATGTPPNSFVIDHADPKRIKTQSLHVALRQEFRGRYLNPKWLKELMAHGYAGARTMGSEFLEYLWGWQVTNPTLVGDWAWEEVHDVYLRDRYALGLDEFLAQGHNAHTKSNVLAIMLVAIHKGFWNASPEIQEELAQEFAQLVTKHGLPGSGHTDPDHPMFSWLMPKLSDELRSELLRTIETARGPQTPKQASPPQIAEIEIPSKDSLAARAATGPDGSSEAARADTEKSPTSLRWIALLALGLVSLGFAKAYRQGQGIHP